MAEENLLITTVDDLVEQVITITKTNVGPSGILTLSDVESQAVAFNKTLDSKEFETIKTAFFNSTTRKYGYNVEKVRYPFFDLDDLHFTDVNRQYFEAQATGVHRIYVESVNLAIDPPVPTEEVVLCVYKYANGGTIITQLVPNEVNMDRKLIDTPDDAALPTRYFTYFNGLSFSETLSVGDRIYVVIAKDSSVDTDKDIILMDNSVTLTIEREI